MSYEFVSVEDAGTHTGDFIMRIRWKPSQLWRWFGAREESVAYYGQNTAWHKMDGLRVSSRVRSVLEEIRHERRPLEGIHGGAAQAIKLSKHMD